LSQGEGATVFNAIVRGERIEFSIAKFGLHKLDTFLYRTVQKHILISGAVKVRLTSMTDRQTDRLCHNKCLANLARPNI